KLSGRSAFRQRLKELRIELDGEDAYDKAFQRFKDLADKKADIFDEDLQALVSDGATDAAAERWQLVRMSQASGTGERPHANLVLAEAGKERKADAEATAGWMRLSRRSSAWPRVAPSCCTTQSMPR